MKKDPPTPLRNPKNRFRRFAAHGVSCETHTSLMCAWPPSHEILAPISNRNSKRLKSALRFQVIARPAAKETLTSEFFASPQSFVGWATQAPQRSATSERNPVDRTARVMHRRAWPIRETRPPWKGAGKLKLETAFRKVRPWRGG